MVRELTVVQIERLLLRKKARMNALNKRRDRLQKALDAVNLKLEKLAGKQRDDRQNPRRGKRRRPKNEKPLYDVVISVLEKNKKGLSLADLSRKVLDTGYKTNSAKFDNTVYQCLYNNQNQIQHDPETRRYGLKKAASAV